MTALANIPDQTAAITVREDGAGAALVRQAMEDLKLIRSFVTNELKMGFDYGIIPGTGNKPTLFKPGAEKVAMYYNAYPQYVRETNELGDGHVEHTVTAYLIHRSSDQRIACGLASCTTMESKYRFRNAKPSCPQCGHEVNVSKDGGGFYCWKKTGGCGATFGSDDSAITSQPRGKVENDNIWDQRNTALKMAEKRALVAAALGLGCLSEMFTQDLEDLGVYDMEHVQATSASPAMPFDVVYPTTGEVIEQSAPPVRAPSARTTPEDEPSAEQREEISRLTQQHYERQPDWSKIKTRKQADGVLATLRGLPDKNTPVSKARGAQGTIPSIVRESIIKASAAQGLAPPDFREMTADDASRYLASLHAVKRGAPIPDAPASDESAPSLDEIAAAVETISHLTELAQNDVLGEALIATDLTHAELSDLTGAERRTLLDHLRLQLGDEDE